jgi:hypothetical protein
MREASDLCEEGEIGEARSLYERLVVGATEPYGAEAEQTLLVRGILVACVYSRFQALRSF